MSHEIVAKRSVAVDVTSAGWALNATNAPNNIQPIGIHCNAATTITAALIGDTGNPSVWVLPAGFSRYAFRTITTASTTKNGFRILFGR